MTVAPSTTAIRSQGRVGWRAALRRRPVLILGAALLGVLLLSLFIGRYPAPYWMSPTTLVEDAMARQLILNLRLPRVLTACLLGMTLSACGTVLQMIFRNPLVEPGFLGVSQGAAFGAAMSIIFLGSSPFLTEGLAALFACLGLALSYFLARRVRYGGWILRLVLSGIAVSALFSSGVGVLKYVADPLTELPDIVFWMLGGLWGVTWTDFLYLVLPTTLGLTIVILMRWRLNNGRFGTGLCQSHQRGQYGTTVKSAPKACLQSGVDQEGNTCFGLDRIQKSGSDFRIQPVAGKVEMSDMVFSDPFGDLVHFGGIGTGFWGCEGRSQQLAHFLFGGHAFQGTLDPAYLFTVKIVFRSRGASS